MEFKRDSLRLFKLTFAAAAACGVIVSANALTIVPIFDSTISNNVHNGPVMEAAINAAIQVFETNYADKFSVELTFMVDTNVALGETDIALATVTYAKFRAALASNATSSVDALALASLPKTTTDPVVGGTQMIISLPLAYKLGLSTQVPTGKNNGTIIYLNTNIMNFTRPNPNNFNYDTQSVVEHEIDEALGGGGAGCNLGAFSQIGATDLFRYATNSANSLLTHTYTTNGDNAYFSVDGTNLWQRFSQQAGTDYGDFWGFYQNQVTFLPGTGVLPASQHTRRSRIRKPRQGSFPTRTILKVIPRRIIITKTPRRTLRPMNSQCSTSLVTRFIATSSCRLPLPFRRS